MFVWTELWIETIALNQRIGCCNYWLTVFSICNILLRYRANVWQIVSSSVYTKFNMNAASDAALSSDNLHWCVPLWVRQVNVQNQRCGSAITPQLLFFFTIHTLQVEIRIFNTTQSCHDFCWASTSNRCFCEGKRKSWKRHRKLKFESTFNHSIFVFQLPVADIFVS